MAKMLCVFLCLCVGLQTVFCQFGFFQPNQNRLNIFGQGILQAPNKIREGIHGLFHPNEQRPSVINQGNPQETVIILEPNNVNNYNDQPARPIIFVEEQNNGNGNFQRPVQGNGGFQANDDNNGVNFQEISNTPQPVNDPVNFEDTRTSIVPEATTLPTLTPVPTMDTDSRSGFNFGSSQGFGEVCTTVEGGLGSCISLYDCPQYLRLIQEARTQAMGILRKAHCGFEGNNPKVCCPRPGFSTVPPETSTTPTTTTTTTTTTPAPPSSQSPIAKSPVGDFIPSLPEPPVCGVSNATFSRVVGGIDAKLGDFPWMALLGYKSRQGGTNWLCGGSLISSRHVLTAAHCIHNHETDLYVVRLGELDLAREDEGATPVDLLIKQKIKHEQYSAMSFTNDIGILILQNDIEFTDLIRPICMPRDSELRARSYEDFNPLIAGWGHTEFRGPSATHLQVLQLPVVSNEFCTQAYSRYKAQTIDQRVLCAGFKKGGKDACQGDSGGPLMQPIWSSQTYKTFFYQIGVVSYGKKCAEAGFPGVYSRVTHFIPWIEEKVLGHSS